MTDPILQILIENINVACRYWNTADRECRRHDETIKSSAYGDYTQDVHANCEGQILKCERIQEELFKDPPV